MQDGKSNELLHGDGCREAIWRPVQVVVNYASSSGAAEEVAEQIKQSGGDATIVQADLSKPEDIKKYPIPTFRPFISQTASLSRSWFVASQSAYPRKHSSLSAHHPTPRGEMRLSGKPVFWSPKAQSSLLTG